MLATKVEDAAIGLRILRHEEVALDRMEGGHSGGHLIVDVVVAHTRGVAYATIHLHEDKQWPCFKEPFQDGMDQSKLPCQRSRFFPGKRGTCAHPLDNDSQYRYCRPRRPGRK